MADPLASVEVPDESLVTIDVTDAPELAEKETPKADGVAAAEEGKEAPAKKTTPVHTDTQVVTDPTEALRAAVKTAEDARKAAEAQAVAERQRADEARALADRRAQEAAAAHETAQDRQLAIITQGIEGATREVGAYQDELSRALEAGEFKKVAEVQAKLSKAAAALDRLEDAKANFEAKVAAAAETKTETTEATSARTPFENYLVQNRFSPKAESWLRAHPECAPAEIGGNPSKHAAMMAGHYDAKAKGLAEGSDDYFRVIEEHAGYRHPVQTQTKTTTAEEAEEAPAVKPKPKPQVAAPVTREAPDAAGRPTQRDVKLNKDQQEAALLSWPQQQGEDTDAWRKRAFGKYARSFLELQAEGKIGRTYV